MKTVEVTYRYRADPESIRERPDDADSARRRLDEGSRAFAALLDSLTDDSATARRVIQVDPYDLGLSSADEGKAPKQRPYAAILGCCDARVPIELIFNEGPNDLFVVRIAGNSLGPDALGSLGYAIDNLGESVKLIVVLGHSGCGAVAAAVDIFLDPSGYVALASNHVLRGLLDRLLVVVNASARRMASVFGPDVSTRSGYREALIETSVLTNAALAAHAMQQELDRRASGLRALYGVYVLASREVWAPRCGSDQCFGLADPPQDVEGFFELGEAMLKSERISALLN